MGRVGRILPRRVWMLCPQRRGCIPARWQELPSAAAAAAAAAARAGAAAPVPGASGCLLESEQGFAKAQAPAIPIRAAVPLVHRFRSEQRLQLWLEEMFRNIAELT